MEITAQTLNSTWRPYLKARLSLSRSLPWSPTEVLAMSLKRIEGNLKRKEAPKLELMLPLTVRLFWGNKCSKANTASLNKEPRVLRVAYIENWIPGRRISNP